MEVASGALARQGSVASRRTPGGARVHSVRFVEVVDGRRVQRAIYLGGDGVHAIRPDGVLRWKLASGEHVGTAPAVGADGTVYAAGQDDVLYAIRPDAAGDISLPAGNTSSSAIAWSTKRPGIEPFEASST